ncbi:hypothetical protein KMW28_00155 [Flammeovirga yaeyamensis]|uniref:Auto-transporter adhesin head GIN domain-containing protein n=1 Tax=Flammeovirga yaeyamensis TaxID=367791 RepID=A0AAX1N8A6_9BACT|nr:hypothetical protein [Flammeovirga yaeyamensis]MBB3700608.1 hypothetical protein [Flammeovirga yaeyamensis]NMF37724.1 hypothetical protein [Flammeovirga yaeyamensis]QWG02033.1 hypothetical protein KMW28_00155 [Flammeovirga yaeyamensis]
MKKSNIFLISLFSSVTLFIISGAIVSVARGKPEPNNNNFTISGPSYGYVLMSKTNYKLNAKAGEKFEFVVGLEKGEEKINLPFITQGDTLVLSPLPEELVSKVRYVEMKFPSKTMNFELKKAHIDIYNSSASSFNIKLDQSKMNIFSKEDHSLEYLNISVKNNSDFYSNTPLNHLKIEINNSSFKSYGSVKEVIGTANDTAKVYISQPGITDFKKDASSRVRFNYN